MAKSRNTSVETIVYKGIAFRRYPESQRRSDRVYFTPSGKCRAQGIKRLHQEMWQDVHGPIPKGHVIHHRDGNPLNNSIENLECVPRGGHQANHVLERLADSEPQEIASHMDRIRPLSKAWHQTPEGKRLHKRLADNLRPTDRSTYTCSHCGKSFEALRAQRGDGCRFCSPACSAAYRRASGIDKETRVCVVCGAEFKVNRYYRTQTCSYACGGKLAILSRQKRTGN